MENDKDNCDSQHNVEMATTTHLKHPFPRRSQLPYPKTSVSKSRHSTSEPALSNNTREMKSRSCHLAKDPDVVQSLPNSDTPTFEGSIGSKVCVGGEKMGILLFYGRTKFAKGNWCGVKLDEAVGKNNGTVEGHRYFTCPPGYGIFAPSDKVTIIHETLANATFQANFEEKTNCREKAERRNGATGDHNRAVTDGFVLDDGKLDTTSVLNQAQSSAANLSFDPNFESTPNNFVQGKMRGNSTFMMNELEEDAAEENADVISNNDDLSELGNAQNGFGLQGSMDYDESLGILTPDQMKDFTLPLDSSCCYLVQTPSDEGIQEITEEEVVDVVEDTTAETTPVDVSERGTGSKWDTPEWVKDYHVWNVGIMDIPKFKEDRLQILENTLSTTFTNTAAETEVNLEQSFSLPQPDIVDVTCYVRKVSTHCEKSASSVLETEEDVAEPMTKEILTPHLLETENINEDSVWTGVTGFMTKDFVETSKVDVVECDVLSMEVDPLTQPNLLRVAEKKEGDKPADMVVSATSIDTGYQGDVECDLQSDSGTNPISTPVDDKQLIDSLPISLEQRLNRGDPGSDSDFCSDMGASWTESEMDMEDKGGQRGGCRSARIIDGRLYYSGASSLREMRTATTTKDHSSDNQCENVQSSEAVVNDLNEAVATDSGASLTTDIDILNETVVKSSDSRLTLMSLESCTSKGEDGVSPVPGTLSYMVQESSSDTLDTTLTLTVTEQTPTRESNNSLSSAVAASPASVVNPQGTTKSHKKESKVNANKRLNKETDNNKSKTPRKNVMSKIKAMIEATSSKLTNKEAGSKDTNADVLNQKNKENKKTPPKNKWNPVMSKIAANQKEEKEKAKSRREVTSRVNSNLTPARTNGQTTNRSPKPDVGATAMAKPVNQKPPIASGNRAATSAKTNQKQSTSQKCRENKARTTADVSEHVISQPSASLKSKLPISERPSTLKIKKAGDHSRSPSELSVASVDSQATTMSQLTLASHTSSRPLPHRDVSSTGPNRLLTGSTPTLCRRAATKSLANKHGTDNEITKTSPRPSKRPLSERVSLLQRNSTRADKKTAAKGTSEMSDAGSQKKSNQTSTGGLLKTGNQPDLLPALGGRSFYQEVSRLEALCENRTKELNVVQIQLKHCALGFDSMAVLINYLANELNAFSVPAVREELNNMQTKYRETDLKLKEFMLGNQKLSKEIGELQDKHMLEQVEIKRRFLNELETRQAEMDRGHQKIIDKLVSQHDEDKAALKLEHSSMIEQLKADFEAKKSDEIQQRNNSMESLKAEHLIELQEMQRSCDAKIQDLQPYVQELNDLKIQYAEMETKMKDLEDVLNSDADVKVQVIKSQLDRLKKEVASLESVLTMKMEEIKKLQQENLKLADKSEQLDKANELIKKLQAKTEDLNEMVQSKTETERNLSSNNEVLLRQFATKAEDNKRLSLENEALQWKLKQQSMNGTVSDCDGNPVNPTNYYYIWDDEGMATSTNRVGFMSSSWGGHSSIKNGSSGSPKDRFTWSPSHSYYTKAKQTTHSTSTHFQRSSKVEDERVHDLSTSGGEIFDSPVTMIIDPPKGKKRNFIHSSTPLVAPLLISAPPADATDCSISTTKNDIAEGATTTPILNITNSNEIPLLCEDCSSESEEQNRVNGGNDHLCTSPAPPISPEIEEEEMKSGLVETNVENFEIKSKQSLIEADSHEAINLLYNKHQIVSEEDEIEVNRWDNFVQISGRASDLSVSEEFLFDEELQMPELEKLYLMSTKGEDYLEIQSKAGHRLISIDQSCPVTSSDEVSFDLNLMDGEVIFTSLQDEFEELILEPMVLNGENDVVGEMNESSSSSEEMLGSLEDSSSLITVTETSSKETASANEELNANMIGNIPILSYDPKAAAIPKTTTTVVITFRPNPTRLSNSSSRDSSPGQPALENTAEDASEALNTDDPSSSSRASPLDESFTLDKKAMQTLNKNVYRGIQSPRTSAGEALMADTEGPQMNVYESHRHQLLKKALQDQLPQSGSSCSSNRELSSDDCSPLVGMSKPDTPDIFVNSAAVNPTIVNGVMNTDDSWSYSDDDLPSETEI